MSHKAKTLFKIIIAATLLTILFYISDVNEVVNHLANVKLVYLPIILLLWLFGVLISALKWYVILLDYRIGGSFLYCFKLYLIGSFFNNFLPTTIGGDSYKVVALSRKEENKGKLKEIILATFLERIIGFIVLAVFAAIFLGYYYRVFLVNIKLLNYLIIIIGLFIIMLILFILRNKIISNLSRVPKLKNILEKFTVIFRLTKKKTIIIAFLISIIFTLQAFFSLYFAFYANHQKIPLSIIALNNSISRLVGIIPISFNNIGVTESLAIYLYGLFDYQTEIVFSTHLLHRFILIIGSLMGLIPYLYDKKTKEVNS